MSRPVKCPVRGAPHHLVEVVHRNSLRDALPDPVVRQLYGSLRMLGPAGRAGSIPAADLQAMHQVIAGQCD